MALDLGLRLLRAGYRALPEERTEHGGADAFETRLLGRRAVVVRGREGAELFYDTTRVRRDGAVPHALSDLLFGRGAVHGLDGEEHLARESNFFEILTPERVDDLATTIGRDLARRVEQWRRREVVVFDELIAVYGAAVLAWAGICLTPGETARTSRRPAAIVDGFGGAEAGDLPARAAGVELLNVLRPTVAVAWPGTFLARALAEHPQRPARWPEPDRFLPERFAGTTPDPFAFVPQGGGDTRTGHRCPGEPLTVRILAETARVLSDVDFEPVGDTSPDPTRIPTLPHGGLTIRSST